MTLEIWYLWVYVEGVWGDGEEGWGQRGGGMWGVGGDVWFRESADLSLYGRCAWIPAKFVENDLSEQGNRL